MRIKTLIKNNLWRWNYVLPFIAKYRADEKGMFDLLMKIRRTYKQIRPVRGKGRKRTIEKDVRRLLEEMEIEINPNNRFIYFLDTHRTIAAQGNILGNFTLDYDKIIHGTFESLVQKAKGADAYGKSAEQVVLGVYELQKRITRAIEQSELPENIKRVRISDFTDMFARPAEHFEEALQRILFFNQILWQTRHRLNGLGRLDVILGSLYQKDKKEALLTRNSAKEAVMDFLLQLSHYPEYKSDALQGDIGQIIVLGGLNADGSYFCNELTDLFLEAQAELKRPDPKVLIRVSRKMPEELLNRAVEALLSVTGSPLFSNDDVVIPALLDFGMPEQDAYGYCVSACWEPFIVGKSMDQNNIAAFDFFCPLDDVLNSNDEYPSFEELLESYIRHSKVEFEKLLDSLDQIKWAKDPLVSLFTDGCSEKRMDISEGAAQYSNYGITTVGLSNVIDSLFNVRKLVFEEHLIDLKELNRIRNKDYIDHDELFQSVQRNKFYGHDREETIRLTNQITAGISETAKKYRNRFGGTVKFGLSSPGYILRGKQSTADVSGRKKGMPYNTHISCLDAPYTEVVRFASGLDYKGQRFNGNVVDYFIAPDFIRKNYEKFVMFLRGGISSGFFQMQMNLMDSSTLIDAKAHPERYAGLIVRVWGFSAYFNDLPEDYKNVLIERAISAEKAA